MFDLSKIAEPISDDQPCGPDLDEEFDMDFMNFVAEVEGDLPTSYFKFDPAAMKFDSYYDRIGELLERTRDIRLLVPLAKLRILQGNIAGFAEAIDALKTLLEAHWSDVHPRPMDGDSSLRTGYLFTLDDMPNSVLPFQHATVIRSRRSGPITLRKWQVASGEVNAREGEDSLDPGAIRSALAETDEAEITTALGHLETIRDALAAIRKVAIEQGGFESAPAYERLPASVDALIALINETTGRGEEAAPEAGAGEEGQEGAAAGAGTVLQAVVLPPGSIASRGEAREVLKIAEKYFTESEPSSPAQILLREALAAVDKDFFSLVKDLVPSQANGSVFRFGKDPYFELSLPDVFSRNAAGSAAASAPAPKSKSSWEASGLGDDEAVEGDVPDSDNGSESEAEAPAAEAAEEADDGWGKKKAPTPEPAPQPAAAEEVDDGWGKKKAAPQPAPQPEAPREVDDGWGKKPAQSAAAAPASAPEDEDEPADDISARFWANSRPEAVALMQKLIAYYRVAEPTSPIPLLLERAIDMSAMTFMDLLGAVLPSGSLRTRATDKAAAEAPASSGKKGGW